MEIEVRNVYGGQNGCGVGDGGVQKKLHRRGVSGGAGRWVVVKRFFSTPSESSAKFSDGGWVERVILDLDDWVGSRMLGSGRNNAVGLVGHGFGLVEEPKDFSVH
jgi:hypothetical protein